MKRHHIATLLTAIGISVGLLIGCHAKPDDAAGQAEELSDPLRRENAIGNLNRLYTSALAAAAVVATATASGNHNDRYFNSTPIPRVGRLVHARSYWTY